MHRIPTGSATSNAADSGRKPVSTSSILWRWSRKFTRNLEDRGWTTALRKSVAYVFRPIFAKANYRLYRIDLRRKPTEALSQIDGVTFRAITSSDTDAIRQIESTEEWLVGTVRQKLSSGALCVAAFEGPALAGFNIVLFGTVFMTLVQLSRTFRPDEAWSEQITTVKAHRKKGLAAQLRYRMFEELRRRNVRKFYGGALADNMPSLKLAERVGFDEFVEIRYRRLLWFSKWRYERLSR